VSEAWDIRKSWPLISDPFRSERLFWVSLHHERFVRIGPLNPNLPPPQTHPQAAAVRQQRANGVSCTMDTMESASGAISGCRPCGGQGAHLTKVIFLRFLSRKKQQAEGGTGGAKRFQKA
jgi:hypothetical protein